MVVWRYPCESKSSPAHYSKHPQLKRWGCFFMCAERGETKKIEGDTEIKRWISNAISLHRTIKLS